MARKSVGGISAVVTLFRSRSVQKKKRDDDSLRKHFCKRDSPRHCTPPAAFLRLRMTVPAISADAIDLTWWPVVLVLACAMLWVLLRPPRVPAGGLLLIGAQYTGVSAAIQSMEARGTLRRMTRFCMADGDGEGEGEGGGDGEEMGEGERSTHISPHLIHHLIHHPQVINPRARGARATCL